MGVQRQWLTNNYAGRTRRSKRSLLTHHLPHLVRLPMRMDFPLITRRLFEMTGFATLARAWQKSREVCHEQQCLGPNGCVSGGARPAAPCAVLARGRSRA